jgi:hypothetical protein
MITEETGGHCPNCSAPLSGPFCSSCGQRQLDLDRPFREIAREAMEAFFDFDARIVRTFWPLISRPGFLTLEFLEGRRVRYVHPFKLYFIMSVLLFLGLAYSGYSVVRVGESGESIVAVTVTEADEATESAENTIESGGDAADEAEDRSALVRSLSNLGRLFEEDPVRFNRIFIDRLAKSIVIMVPVFALLLRVLFWRRPYIAHLVFSLHLHSFGFLAILLGMAIDLASRAPEGQGFGSPLAVVAIAVHTFLALRRFAGQGRLLTILKMIILLLLYLMALILTMILTLALTVVTM